MDRQGQKRIDRDRQGYDKVRYRKNKDRQGQTKIYKNRQR